MTYFATKHRDDGTMLVVTADTAPDWVAGAVREAHDDELPNDWRYAACRDIFDAFEDWADPSDLDSFHEIADGLTETAASELYRWLAEYPGRTAYHDDDPADTDIPSATMTAQYRCILAMTEVIAGAIVENQGEER